MKKEYTIRFDLMMITKKGKKWCFGIRAIDRIMPSIRAGISTWYLRTWHIMDNGDEIFIRQEAI